MLVQCSRQDEHSERNPEFCDAARVLLVVLGVCDGSALEYGLSPVITCGVQSGCSTGG
jgi:hypothetical protein